MILDIEQRDKDIIISYYDANGEVAFKKYAIDQFSNWYICDPKDKNVNRQYKNWDGRSIKKGFARQFNKFPLFYFVDGWLERDIADSFAYNMPKTYLHDKETLAAMNEEEGQQNEQQRMLEAAPIAADAANSMMAAQQSMGAAVV